MAVMFPKQFPRAFVQEDPEMEVYETLRRLPDSYSVFYSKKFKGGRRAQEECEIDFIIFDGKTSLLCLEVKGGQIRYSGEEETWYQNDHRMNKSPDRQASAGMHCVLEYLGQDAKDVNVGWGLCFPHCSLPVAFTPPAAIPRDILIDGDGMLELETGIQKMETYYAARFNGAGVDNAGAQRLRNKLTRGIGFVTRLGTRVARDYEQILEVTDEQFSVLEDLEANPRMVVKGTAGSGKTLLAQEYARRLEAEGQSVLLLFFNRIIVNSARRSFGRDSKVNCKTFHSLAKRLIEDADPDWWGEQDSQAEDFWEFAVPMKFADIAHHHSGKFDAIIVDEGQDFRKEWFEVLSSLLVDPDNGRFIVFYDDGQDIFRRWNDLPWGGSGIARKQLKNNCRNTKSIVDFVNDHFDCEMESFARSPEGKATVERTVEDREAEQKILIEDVSQLLGEGINPKQIVLLLNEPRRDSCIADLAEIKNQEIKAIGRYFPDRDAELQYSTIRLFKGLESDVVFVFGLHGCSEEEFNEAVYTQGTRARSLLYIYRPKEFTVAADTTAKEPTS